MRRLTFYGTLEGTYFLETTRYYVVVTRSFLEATRFMLCDILFAQHNTLMPQKFILVERFNLLLSLAAFGNSQL